MPEASLSMTDARPAGERRSNPWVVLATLLVIYTFNLADRYLLTGLIGPIKAEFGIGDGTIGLLMGPAFVICYVALGIPIARLADRSNRVRIIAAGCVVWSLATVATGMATGPVGLALARIGVGIGEAAFFAPAVSLLSDYFRPERRGLAIAVLSLATYFGQIMGQAGGPALAAIDNWRLAFYAMGVPGVLLGLLALLLIREPRHTARVPDGRADRETPLLALVVRLARTPCFVLLTAGFVLGSLSGIAFGFWGAELMTRLYDLDPVKVKSAFALNFGLSSLVGMLLFGVVADRVASRGMHWPVRLSALAILVVTVATLLVTWSDRFTTAILLAVPAGLVGGGWGVGVMVTLQYILPPRIRASGTALLNTITALTAYVVAPWVTGLLSEALGDSAASLRMALTLIIPCGFAGAVFAWLAARRVEADRAALAAD